MALGNDASKTQKAWGGFELGSITGWVQSYKRTGRTIRFQWVGFDAEDSQLFREYDKNILRLNFSPDDRARGTLKSQSFEAKHIRGIRDLSGTLAEVVPEDVLEWQKIYKLRDQSCTGALQHPCGLLATRPPTPIC